MTLTQLGIILAVISSTIAAGTTLYRFFREHKHNRLQDKSSATKADAEKGQIFLQGAESAVLVMEKALNIAYANNERIQLERDAERSRNEELRAQVYTQEVQIRELQHRVAELEAGRSTA